MSAFTTISCADLVAFAMTLALAGCGGEPAAARLTVFDPSAGLGAVDLARSRVEAPYPALDRAAEASLRREILAALGQHVDAALVH